MNENDLMMYDYLLEMGAMNPELEQMKRRQAQVDALRGAKMGAGEMVGSGGYQHYVPKGIAGALSTLGQNALGAYEQKQVDATNKDMNSRQAASLEALRKRMMARRAPTTNAAGIPLGMNEDPFAGM